MERQTTLFDTDDDGLIIIGTPRNAQGAQIHSTFRKIDMAAKQGKLISFEWGEIMVMLPRSLYDELFAYITRTGHESRAAALMLLLQEGLTACSE